MAEKKYRVVHYLNQFFAQIGGEAEANIPPLIKEGAVGPGIPLQQALGEGGGIVATMVCGDTYFAENIEAAAEKVVEFVSPYKPDVFVAGPAFTAGRYGIACGASCAAVSKKLGIGGDSHVRREPGIGSLPQGGLHHPLRQFDSRYERGHS